MYSPHITLKEFVIAIPICQENASLETILNASELSRRGAIAVVNFQQFPLGIISNDRLLKFLSQKLQHQATVAVGLSQQLSHTVGLSATKKLDFLMETVTILPSQMKVQEFLPQLENATNTGEQIPKYLVIDAGQRLLGLLNTQEILISLVFSSQKQQHVDSSLTIEQADFPSFFKIGSGENIEPSSCRQKLFNFQGQSDLIPVTKQPAVTQNHPELIKLNYLKDELFANITHELKSPLTGIVGLSNLLKEQKLGSLNERQLHYAKLIYRNGRKLMDIVSNLLDLTNLATGKLKLNLESVEIESLCRQTYEQVLTRLASKLDTDIGHNHQSQDYSNRIFQLKIEPGGETAIADKLRLSQILTYLLQNVVEHSQPQDKVGIDVNLRKDGITFTIWQSEKHTDLNSASKLSAASINSNIAATLDSEPTDLSLVLAQKLATLHGGDISCTINKGQGREFNLLLPVRNLPTQKHSNLEHLTILCLYPESELLDLSSNATSNLDFDLKDWAEQAWIDESNTVGQKHNYHCRVIEADGLEQADMLARIWQLDAVVFDGHLIKNSIAYLRSLQKIEHLANLPLIVLDSKTSAAASQVEGLDVYPCLVPAECRSIQDLMQVIQIATEK